MDVIKVDFRTDTCDAPSIENLVTEITFPINYGTRLTVTCAEGHTLIGDNMITCLKGDRYTYRTEPSCNRSKAML